MSDRELLEMAAKAAGIPNPQIHSWPGMDVRYGLTCAVWDGESYWNPLEDDGDALRMAVKLGICLGPNLDADAAVAFGNDGRNMVEPHDDDPYAATRRAIVRAAAEIGRSNHE